ncbi:MAG: 4Fe-4S dicluster domain-containing protein [Bdellovibrio sp.]|nr:MAG: 4Fe-4S dicluster domain-containing protein [Bdellovibrio sp.]
MENSQEQKKYWLSLEQWKDDPEFKKMAQNEFLSTPLDDNGNAGEEGWARRDFLKLMGASLALSSFGCVRRAAQKIVPYAKRPPEIVPGISNYYSSAFTDGEEAFGVVLTTREGRPIKVEGNSFDPSTHGGMSVRAHAHILSLYDPDRVKGPQKISNGHGKDIQWEELDKKVVESLKQGTVALLTGALLSPSTQELVKTFNKTFGVEHFVWEPFSRSVVAKAQKLCYGKAVYPRYRWEKADFVVSVGADFLGAGFSATENTAQWSRRRRPDGDMSRLVVFESLMSLTGANADDRYRVRPSDYVRVLMGLAYEIVVAGGHSRFANDSQVKKVLQPYATASEALGFDPQVFKSLAKELWAKRGKSLVVVGDLPGQSTEALSLQIAANFLNSLLENDGKTIDFATSPYVGLRSQGNDLQRLKKAIDDGSVKTLIIHGVNPIYSAPASLGLKDSLKKVNLIVYTGDRVDETGAVSHLLAPDHHLMENWGDVEAHKGHYLVQQPTIEPLYKTRSFQDSLIQWIRSSGGSFSEENWYHYLRAYWKKHIYPSFAKGRTFEDFWIDVLHKGIVFDESREAQNHGSRPFLSSAWKSFSDRAPSKGPELVLYATSGLKDGAMANVSWLQEFPDPVTKISWDNYLCVSYETATKNGWKEGQVVKVSVNGQTVEVPLHIQAGQHNDVFGLAVGYGRTRAGEVANGVGVNAFQLAGFSEEGPVYSALPVKVEATDKMIPLACVQGHHSMEGRQIVVEATLNQYRMSPSANIHRHKIFSMWSKHEYKGHKWAMAVDLSACTGCGTCMVACQSENNVPVVGKKYLLQGRQMYWIRVDRYYEGDPQDPNTVFMPVMCQQCDNAPCETVCPVAATSHNHEGLNEMIYNRCVGTRYCANNCPYKVRRFNWFDYTGLRSPLHLALNPEVTVRSRGVMEKCSFCSHRIVQAKNRVRNEEGRKPDKNGRILKDGEVTPACAQSCPTKAIVFGDMNNPMSKVSLKFKEKRSYSLLEELNNIPSVRYQTKIRNTKRSSSHHQQDGHS